jgi:hypothetical protein
VTYRCIQRGREHAPVPPSASWGVGATERAGVSHADHGGDLCHGDDACTTCGVLLDHCPTCNGRGYHRAGCVHSEDT